MDTADIYDAVEDAVSKAFSKNQEEDESENPHMIAIQAFDAFNELDEAVRVVGIINSGAGLDFIVIKEDLQGDGEFYPMTMGGIFKKKSTD